MLRESFAFKHKPKELPKAWSLFGENTELFNSLYCPFSRTVCNGRSWEPSDYLESISWEFKPFCLCVKNMSIAHRKDYVCVPLSKKKMLEQVFFRTWAMQRNFLNSLNIATCWLAGAVCACLVKQAHQRNICFLSWVQLHLECKKRNAIPFLGARNAIKGRDREEERGSRGQLLCWLKLEHEWSLDSFDVLDKKSSSMLWRSLQHECFFVCVFPIYVVWFMST